MEIAKAIELAEKEFDRLTKLPVSSVSGVNRKDGQWVITLEAIERKAVPDTMDMLGCYDVVVDENGSVMAFERKRMRRRGDAEE